MHKKAFIFGASTLGKILYYHLKNEGCPPAAFVLDDKYCGCAHFCGVPLIPYSRISEALSPEDYAAYVAIGYTKMNAARQNVCRRLQQAGYDLPNYIHPSVINCSIAIGSGNLVFQGTILDVQTKIGSGNIFYPGAMISHDTCIGDYNFFAPRVALAGDITVGKRCFFGLNSSVKNGVKISDCCLIGAAAYLNHNLEEGSVLAAVKSVLLKESSEEIIQKIMGVNTKENLMDMVEIREK